MRARAAQRFLPARPLLTGAVALLLAAAARGHVVPPDPDVRTTHLSEAGQFTAHYVPDRTPVPVGPLQRWTLTLTTPGGDPVRGALVTVSGGMPAHGHGLPTAPTVREVGRPGEYRVDGLKFQMPGLWTVRFTVQAGQIRDAAQFNLRLR